MRHDISDGLTGEEARAVVAHLLRAVDAHDADHDTRGLFRGVLNTVRLAELLATTCDGDRGRPAVPVQAVVA